MRKRKESNRFQGDIPRNWLRLIQLDRRWEERKESYEISYCRSIDRSFGSIEKNIMFLLLSLFLLLFQFFFSMSVWKRDIDRKNEWMNDFFSSLSFSSTASKQVNAHIHIERRRRRRRTCSSSSFSSIIRTTGCLSKSIKLLTCSFSFYSLIYLSFTNGQ